MKVAIIGAGNVGTALATALTRAGHKVTITARDPGNAKKAAEQTGATAAPSNAAAADQADVVIAAVPATSIGDVAADIREPARGKPVVDVTNRMAPSDRGLDMDTTSSNAEELASMLPASPVVKAFNTLFASKQADPTTDGVQLDGYVAGDDEDAKAAVLDLVESIGLRPVDVGPLKRARQLESLAFLNIALNAEKGGSWQSGWKLVGAPDTVSSDSVSSETLSSDTAEAGAR
ncbi:MAG TPA: NAD(P)-binding domain-containing protein [Candidatus Limnocylindrales bacterium]|nr:NAD(P)-binding domain-containing protein [Candidatus Limnocylindrales bacterium]